MFTAPRGPTKAVCYIVHVVDLGNIVSTMHTPYMRHNDQTIDDDDTIDTVVYR